MKVLRTLIAALAVAAFTILAQTLLTMGASSAETIPQPAAPANIAIIDSSAFSNDKTGINRVMNGMRTLDVKFQPLRAEIRGMFERLNTMRSDIQKKRLAQDPRVTQQQTEEADRLEVQIKRKQEDAQVAYQKESVAVLNPLQNEIAGALNAYAQANGITLVLDANRVPIIYAAQSLDITRAFIDDYNRKYPATLITPAATPAAARPSPARPSPTRPARP